jgi:hypothetical protein
MAVEHVIQPGLVWVESQGGPSGYLTALYIWLWLFLELPNNKLALSCEIGHSETSPTSRIC